MLQGTRRTDKGVMSTNVVVPLMSDKAIDVVVVAK